MGNEETDPKKTRFTKSAAVNKDIISIKLSDITFDIFSQLSAGEICRFGDGWILRCPECEELITTDSEFKTYDTSKDDKALWRLAPSLSCPNDQCDWHRSVVIEPEEIVEEAEGTEEEVVVEETTETTEPTESVKTEEDDKVVDISEGTFGQRFNKSLENSP